MSAVNDVTEIHEAARATLAAAKARIEDGTGDTTNLVGDQLSAIWKAIDVLATAIDSTE